MRHRSILEYAQFRWLKAALLLSILAGVVYLWDDPGVKPHGGTALGYTLGTVGAAMILWLTWYGVRKRRYRSVSGTVQGWLSAHVYLGVALVVVVTLHTGFEVGWNVHTLAYVLMVAVVASGIYGTVAYLRVPRAMTQNLGEDTLDQIVLRIADIDRDMREMALSLPDELFALVDASVTGTRLGGSLDNLVSGRDPQCPTSLAIRRWPAAVRTLAGDMGSRDKDVFARLLKKHELLERARRDLRHKAIIDLWLYIHVPLAMALLAALVAHVVAVFIYW